ncbi:uncharacterized protein BJ171DRAFT_578964 [Polychytrium aggregatum]|uniref:uncharacterized protein n=1 Tax=Polychytrium aggregatum TaxID=110093 RepID=UPI0022FDF355|nr:uncharacterized protein BJ171DRAFT_578964 [Polychytrium aggregatum]KAI9207235.1 hypothetical protein BJ171DRAFT_578964 [Polychytrium aggregatum]
MTKIPLAVVTGASRGIGLEIARRFLENNVATVMISRNPARLEASRHGLLESTPGLSASSLFALKCNVADQTSVDEVWEEINSLGHVHYLVNAAGIAVDGLLVQAKRNDIEAVLNTNLFGTISMCKAASKVMLRNRKGSIVNISSVVGVSGNEGQSIYAASKAGVIGFSKSLAKELASRGVRVNSVSPGFIETDMTAHLSDAKRAHYISRIPLGKFGHPQDVAEGVMYLLDAPYVTGQNLVIDGGLLA